LICNWLSQLGSSIFPVSRHHNGTAATLGLGP
jgi:hypothetical protein